MISADDVYDVFLTLISPEVCKGTDRALSLCSTSLEKLLKTLKEGADLKDPRISYAAACSAYYDFMLSQMTDLEGNSDFKAGDLTVKTKIRDTLCVAEKIKENGLETIRDLLRDDSFGAWSV